METRPIDALAAGFEFNTAILPDLLEGFSREDLRRRIEGAKPAAWLLGHVALCRRILARDIGMDLPVEPWEARFDRESPAEPADDWPDAAELLAEATATGGRIVARLRELGEEGLAAPMRHPLGEQQATVAHTVGFMFFHEAYHLGQIGLIRSMVGLPYLA